MCSNFGFGNFSSITVHFQKTFLRSKLPSFFIIYLIVCQASCPFAAVETDTKNVTGSVAASNNRTSSAYSYTVMYLIRYFQGVKYIDRKLVPTNRCRT